MKQGSTLQELAAKLESIRETSNDYMVPISKMTMNPSCMLEIDGIEEKNPTAWAHSQLSSILDIPKNYYDRVLEQNKYLLSQCVNHGLVMAAANIKNNKHPVKLIRTVGNDLRAVLSSRYRRLDCHDLLTEVLPLIIDANMDIVSCELTDKKMYVKALTPKLKADIKVGDTVQHGLVISGSDIGCGAIQVQPLIYRLVCKNGLISNSSLRKHHIGKDLSSFEGILSDRSKDLSDASLWSTIKDVVKDSLKPESFMCEVESLRRAANDEIKSDDIPKVIDLSMKAVGVSGEKLKNTMLKYLASGADGAGYNKYGLANSLTWAAQSIDVDYEEATDLEKAGGKIIALEKKDWDAIAI